MLEAARVGNWDRVVKLEGEPTSVAAIGKFVLVGLNTSKSKTEPSGAVLAVGMDDRKPIAGRAHRNHDIQGRQHGQPLQA